MKKQKLSQQQIVERHLLSAIRAKVITQNPIGREHWRGQQRAFESMLAMTLGGNSDPTNTVLNQTYC